MKLSTLNGKLKLLSVNTNTKTSKSSSKFSDTLTAIMYLAPETLGGRGNVCANASDSCKKYCLWSSGKGGLDTVKNARIRKTQLFFDDIKTFKDYLKHDLNLFNTYCQEHNLEPFVRLNGTSDIDWSKIKYKDLNSKNIYEIFEDINFYEYTKDPKRISNFKNLKLTYSYSELNSFNDVQNKINDNINVAVVFDKLPETWNSIKVINGDESDLRFKDEQGVIVGLTPKGSLRRAVKENTDNNFVIRVINIT